MLQNHCSSFLYPKKEVLSQKLGMFAQGIVQIVITTLRSDRHEAQAFPVTRAVCHFDVGAERLWWSSHTSRRGAG
jgi:hypothetical protein